MIRVQSWVHQFFRRKFDFEDDLEENIRRSNLYAMGKSPCIYIRRLNLLQRKNPCVVHYRLLTTQRGPPLSFKFLRRRPRHAARASASSWATTRSSECLQQNESPHGYIITGPLSREVGDFGAKSVGLGKERQCPPTFGNGSQL